MLKNISISAHNLKSTRVICACAVLAALYVVLYSVKLPVLSLFSIQDLRITFTFIPLMLAGWLFGAIPAMLVGVIGDIIGALLFPSGAYFPGFTLTALLSGFIYGFFLYQCKQTLLNIFLSKLCVNLFIHVLLNSYWISLITGKGYLLYLYSHFFKNVALLPLETVIMICILSLLKSHGIQRMYK